MSEKRVEEAPAELSAKVRPPPTARSRPRRAPSRPPPPSGPDRPADGGGRARPSANGERGRGARGPARGIPLGEVGGGAERRGAERDAERPAAALRPADLGAREGLRAALAGGEKRKADQNGAQRWRQTAGGAPTTCRPAPAGGGRGRAPRRERAVPWPGAALPGAARPAPRRAASRAALRAWESRAARRVLSAPPFCIFCPELSLSGTARPIGFVSGR